MKVAGKLTIGGFALYGLSEVLSSQDNAIKHISFLNSKTRENIPVNLPEVSFFNFSKNIQGGVHNVRLVKYK